MRSWLKRQVYKRVTSLKRREAAHARGEANRRRTGAPCRLTYFHRIGDPASALTAPMLARLAGRFDIAVDVFLVGRPEAAVMPEPERLEAFARADAERLARQFGLTFRDPGTRPDPVRTARAEIAADACLDGPDALQAICDIDAAFWSGDALPETGRATGDEARTAARMKAAEARRDAAGHFQSATVLLDGEWYWGADRFHYLEARLGTQGLRRSDMTGAAPLAPILHESLASGDVHGAELEFFPSLRSPYTYLAAQRTFDLARRWNARVKISFVLPMVMRALPVPRRKGVYFLKDCAREAERIGLDFGDICDPLGRPAERGLAVLHHAIAAGRGEAFLLSYLSGVWSQGIDAGSDRGLRKLAGRAGLDWAATRTALADDSWRVTAETNRARLTGLGLWGVPSYRIGDCAVWGQDRLWVVEEALARLAGETA